MNTDNLPLVSICCLSYNHAKYIPEAVKSFWNQEYKNIETLALDDGSSDESLSILKKLEKQSPCSMKVFGQKNTGRISYNFNLLLKKAKGKYVGIISLDDCLYPTAISEKIPIMEADDKCAFVFNSSITCIDKNSIPYKEDNLILFNKTDATAEDIIENEYHMNWTYYCQGTFYRADILKAVGYLDEDLLADDYALRIKTASYLKSNSFLYFQNLNNPACFYRRHSNNISRNLLRGTLLIGDVLDKYYPNRKKPSEYKKALKNSIWYINFEQFKKLHLFKGEKFMTLKELLFFSCYKIRALFKILFRIHLRKNKKIIRFFGITFYHKGIE